MCIRDSYSAGDYSSLESAMQAFAFPFVPSKDQLGTKIKLVLAFSRTLSDYPEAEFYANEVSTIVAAQQEPWTQYFMPDVELFDCSNTESEDLYDPHQQGTMDEFGEEVRWVSGPNRQFEKMMRHVMDIVPNGIIFMKEFDTVPQVDNHYGILLDEIQQNEPFYMLGR